MIVTLKLIDSKDLGLGISYCLIFELSDYSNTNVPCISYKDKVDIKNKKGLVTYITATEKTNIAKYEVG
jgi:hypothetical protein